MADELQFPLMESAGFVYGTSGTEYWGYLRKSWNNALQIIQRAWFNVMNHARFDLIENEDPSKTKTDLLVNEDGSAA